MHLIQPAFVLLVDSKRRVHLAVLLHSQDQHRFSPPLTSLNNLHPVHQDPSGRLPRMNWRHLNQVLLKHSSQPKKSRVQKSRWQHRNTHVSIYRSHLPPSLFFRGFINLRKTNTILTRYVLLRYHRRGGRRC